MEDKERKKTCCFFGHRKINETEELRDRMFKTIEQLITETVLTLFYLAAKASLTILLTRLYQSWKKNIHISSEYMSGRHTNTFQIGMKKACLNIMRILTFLNIWKMPVELLMWKEIKKWLKKAITVSAIMMKTIYPHAEKTVAEIYLIINQKAEQK